MVRGKLHCRAQVTNEYVYARQECEQRLAACEQAAAQQQRDAAECSARAQAQRLEVERAGRALQAERAELQVAHDSCRTVPVRQWQKEAQRPGGRRAGSCAPCSGQPAHFRVSWQLSGLCMHGVAVPFCSPLSQLSKVNGNLQGLRCTSIA